MQDALQFTAERDSSFGQIRRGLEQVLIGNDLAGGVEQQRRDRLAAAHASLSDELFADAQRQLVTSIRAFIAMYRPHAAREDTDLFPKLGSLVSSNEYHAMAEDFEKEEHCLFGEDGFEKMVERIARLEQAIGIHDLNQFTPG